VQASRLRFNMLTSTEIIIGKIWSELLQLEAINSDDNFFEMGGDSLMTMEMLIRVGEALGVEVHPGNIMDAPTLREFCQVIDRKRADISLIDDSEQSEADAIIPCARNSLLPVSFIQEQIVGAELAGLYDPDKTRSHCLDLCYRIKGAIDITALDNALCEIVRRHEILRTSYGVTDGTIFQNVNEAPPAMLNEVDLRKLKQNDKKVIEEHFLERIAKYSFSFFNDKNMISAILIKNDTDDNALIIVVNHVAIDGLSMTILRNELFMLYEAFSRHKTSPLSDLPIQYADFAVWEREHFSGDRLESKLAYWRQIARKPLNTTLPADRKPTAISYAGDIVPVTIPAELSTRLRQFGRECKVTLFTVLFAGFIASIHAFSGYRSNFFCIPVANRSRRTRSLIGCFMNFQFVYIDLSGNPTFLELIERLNKTLHDVYDNYVPFHFITQQIPPQGPVVDFQLLNSPDESIDAIAAPEGLTLSPFKLQTQVFALFPIDVRMQDSSEAITGQFKYQTAAYDRKTITDMVDDYVSLLTRTANNPNMRLNDMGIKPHKNAVH
jgi:acyl carrier protein